MNGLMKESLTSNFKIIRQGHVIYLKFFEFYDLKYVENVTNRITSSHLYQTISRITNRENRAFWPPSYTFWRHDIRHVTAPRLCQNVPPISINRYDETIFAIGIIKTFQGKNARGWYPPFRRPRVKN